MHQWVTSKIQFFKKLKILFTEEKKKIKDQGQNVLLDEFCKTLSKQAGCR